MSTQHINTKSTHNPDPIVKLKHQTKTDPIIPPEVAPFAFYKTSLSPSLAGL